MSRNYCTKWAEVYPFGAAQQAFAVPLASITFHLFLMLFSSSLPLTFVSPCILHPSLTLVFISLSNLLLFWLIPVLLRQLVFSYLLFVLVPFPPCYCLLSLLASSVFDCFHLHPTRPLCSLAFPFVLGRLYIFLPRASVFLILIFSNVDHLDFSLSAF